MRLYGESRFIYKSFGTGEGLHQITLPQGAFPYSSVGKIFRARQLL